MNRQDLLSIMESAFSRVKNLEATKGKEYTDGGSDRLENFKGEAAEVGITELQIWAVYASKHYRAIKSFIRNDGEVFSNESIDSRIDDLILYLLLLQGLVHDRQQAKKLTPVEFVPFQQMEERPLR